jgi:hypothetical protein
VDDEEEAPPTPRWYDVAAGNETQVKAWLGYANEVLDHYKVQGMPMMTLLSVVAQKIPGLRPENYSMVMAQVEKTLRESPAFELRKGRSGGLFRKDAQYITLQPMLNVPDLITNDVKRDNYVCKGCKNEKLSTQEKSCWKCGREVGT